MFGDIRLLKSFYILATSPRTYIYICKFDVGTIYGFDIEIINHYA
jgi:hypothetical protein